MKCIHSNIGKNYYWTKRIQDQFLSLYEKSKQLNIFSAKNKDFLTIHIQSLGII